MQDAVIHSLVVALAAAGRRGEAAAALAAALGCETLALLVRDTALNVLLPAPGMPKTFPGGPQWRAFLAACGKPGRHQAMVDLPAGSVRQATDRKSVV